MARATAGSGAIEIVEVTTRRDLDAFIRLPGQLAAADPAWVEPLLVERRQFLSPAHNPVFEHATVRLWLARQGGRPVGRISAQIDRLVPEEDGHRPGAFGLLDARDDAVLALLFGTAEGWLSAQGVRRVRGPFGLSVNQTSGVLVDGFSSRPYLMMDHHDPWLGPAVERQGYAKVQDLIAYYVDTAPRLPDRLRRLCERGSPGVRMRPMDKRRYAQEIATITEIFNDAWAGNWGFVPLTEAETAAMARELRPILPADFVQIAELDGRPVAFIVMLPNVNEALRGLNGRLLPFGWARLLWRLKVAGVRSGRVPLMGMRREIAGTLLGKSLPLRLIYALEEPARRRGVTRLELSWLLEQNRPMRRIVEMIGAHPYKTYRLYEKDLPCAGTP